MLQLNQTGGHKFSRKQFLKLRMRKESPKKHKTNNVAIMESGEYAFGQIDFRVFCQCFFLRQPFLFAHSNDIS